MFSRFSLYSWWKLCDESSASVLLCPRKVPRYEDDNIRAEMVSGSGSGEWRVKGRLVTSVQHYSTIKETLEKQNLTLIQTGGGTLPAEELLCTSFCSILKYVKQKFLFFFLNRSLISDISCLASRWHLLLFPPSGCVNIWWGWLHCSVREDKLEVLTLKKRAVCIYVKRLLSPVSISIFVVIL